jgi:hypothetical protein
MSVHRSIQQEALADFMALSKLILEHADNDLQLLHIVCILRVILLEYYKLPNVIPFIYEVFGYVKSLFESVAIKPLCLLLLEQAKNVYASFLHYSKSLSQPDGIVKEVVTLLLVHGKLREANMYFMKANNSIKEWIGYLYFVKDMSSESTMLGSLMKLLFIFQLKQFLSSIFPKAKRKCLEKVKVFEWLNELTSFSIKINPKPKPMKFINKLYRSRYKDNEAFKKAGNQNITANQETGLESGLISSLAPTATKANVYIEEDKEIINSKEPHGDTAARDDRSKEAEEKEVQNTDDGSRGEDIADDNDSYISLNSFITCDFTSSKKSSINLIEENKTLPISSEYKQMLPQRNIINRLCCEPQDLDKTLDRIEALKFSAEEKIGRNLIMSEAGIVSSINMINNQLIKTNFNQYVTHTSTKISTERKTKPQLFFETMKERY